MNTTLSETTDTAAAGCNFRVRLAEYVSSQALPVDKLGHQPRLYALTRLVGEGMNYDDDVVFAAAWLHDLGVFVGHRPEDPVELARWDHVRYACERAPEILHDAGFPAEKIPAVLAAIREHQPQDNPTSIEATILRDADILEQLGAIGALRTVAKVGRDTRYATFTDAVKTLATVRSAPIAPSCSRMSASRKIVASM